MSRKIVIPAYVVTVATYIVGCEHRPMRPERSRREFHHRNTIRQLITVHFGSILVIHADVKVSGIGVALASYQVSRPNSDVEEYFLTLSCDEPPSQHTPLARLRVDGGFACGATTDRFLSTSR